MINRIEAAYEEIIKWKKFFEKHFSSDVMNSRTFKLEELAMFERITSRSNKGLTRDEIFFKKMAGQQRRNLVRSLYPNPLIRLIRNTLVRGIGAARSIVKLIAGNPSGANNSGLYHQCRRLGFKDVEKALESKLERGEKNFRIDQYISTKDRQMLSYSLDFGSDDGQRILLKGFDVIRHSPGNKSEQFRFDLSSGIDAQQAAELSCGRAVYAGNGSWKLVDFNDRNADGCFLPKQITISDFDIEKSLSNLPIMLSESQKFQLEQGLKQGRRMAIDAEVDGKKMALEIEAVPLKRSLQLYQDGKKIALDGTHQAKQSIQSREGTLKVAHRSKGIGRSKSN